MNLSKKFEELILKQLESFGCSMGVTHLVMYLASAKQGTKATFEMIGQWPQIDRILISIEDDPSLKVSSPNRRWYPLQENDILLGVLRVETDLKGGDWPVSLDSRLKALSLSLAKCVSIELERQNKNKEINYLKNQVNVVIHQLRNPLAALRTYAKLLIKRLGSDYDSIEIVERMLIEQKQINQYMNSFEQLNEPIHLPLEIGEERLLLPPNLDNKKEITVQSLLRPILERGEANAKLDNRDWSEPSLWPDWTLSPVKGKYVVIAEIVANLLENAFKYAQKGSEIGIIITSKGICIFDDGKKISKNENEKIFQKGFRGAASKKKDGTGVGLFLARKLAQQIGGELNLLEKSSINNVDELKNLKKKNIFYLELPTTELHS
ncbi:MULTISPECIES: sensor histidine kinase [Prochlorococcus]|uniref:histidine kinase n=1 Tax=Prochlorococcus marinus str. MIT 9116 TaxID=167544 RepID=A0A0A1ZKF0_PROMR|nr:HAMP domain-containing sensor histidine kinase [Prochlorococcus marinus]KGF89138.1 two-component sensor histidine kinase [Prochlorococcus marinus str. MIT 9107]KGF89895.1 two-component sensor histidine kinase [Prochlorococcus marinus str. MIT 9116]KGF95225.1 two-component sensor histidine kinase [Prochlorococcus marinus str. MIT 9123]